MPASLSHRPSHTPDPLVAIKQNKIMNKLLTILLTISVITSNCQNSSEQKTEEFSFDHDGLKYSGFIDLPKGKPKAIIILIPGSGENRFFRKYGVRKLFFNKREMNFYLEDLVYVLGTNMDVVKARGSLKRICLLKKVLVLY